jgi:transcriptional regulatory protein LevR
MVTPMTVPVAGTTIHTITTTMKTMSMMRGMRMFIRMGSVAATTMVIHTTTCMNTIIMKMVPAAVTTTHTIKNRASYGAGDEITVSEMPYRAGADRNGVYLFL